MTRRKTLRGLVFLGVFYVSAFSRKAFNTEDTEKNENTLNSEKGRNLIREIFIRPTKTESAPMQP